MDNLAVCILSRGRADKQITLKNLPMSIRRNAFLIVDEDEHHEYKKLHKRRISNILSMDPLDRGHNFGGNFSDKKEWTAKIMHKNGYQYIFFLDDDMYFCARKNGKLVKAETRDVRRIFEILYLHMEENDYAHVALSPREGNNRVDSNHIENSRAYRFCGFDLDVIHKEKLKFNRTLLMADFDITLQLLELGYKNLVMYNYANGTSGSNAAGGCSIYRSPDTMTEAAHALKSLHPKFVKVETKTTAKPWAGFDTNERTDVTVYWKKAYTYGKGQKKGIKSFLKRR